VATRNPERGTRNALSAIPNGIRLVVHVQPRAARTGIAGRYGDGIKVRLAAPPVDGAANAALIRFLAEILRRPQAAIRLTAGMTARRKTVEVAGIGVAEAGRRLGLPEAGAGG
jgi:uncharacterized protein (TIGR00251 family)